MTLAQLKADVDAKFALFNTAMATYQARLEEANKAIQTKLDSLSKGYVDDLEIGGRNLALNTSTEWKSISWEGRYWEGTFIRYTDAKPGEYYSMSIHLRNVQDPLGGALLLWVRWLDENGIKDGSYAFNGSLVYDEGVSKATFIIPEGKYGFEVLIRSTQKDSTKSVEYRMFKAEKGTKATDWTPAPEDVQAEIDAAKNEALALDYLKEAIGQDAVIDGALFTLVTILLKERMDGDVTAGTSGKQTGEGGQKNLPAFWAGGKYDEAIGNTAKAIIRHDGSSKFTDTEIEGTVTAGGVNSARTEINDAGVQIFNTLNIMNIRFGLKNGYAIMEYYDNDGNLLYDLGPNGLGNLLVRAEGWTEIKKIRLTAEFSTSLDPMQLPIGESYKDMSNATIITCYRYTSAISDGVNTDLVNDGRIFNAPEISSGKILNSVYCDYDLSKGFLYPTKGTNSRLFGVDLPKFNMANEPVYDRYSLYYRPLQKYASGVIVGEINAYWNHP